MAIWWHLGRRKGDSGQVWLALSVLCWSMAGFGQIYFASNPSSEYVANGWQSIVSIFNSLFILLSLPYFQFIPDRLTHLIKSEYWKFIIGFPFVFALLPTVSKLIGLGEGTIRELDVYFSLMTLIFLGIVLWESFDKRNLRYLAILSVVTIFVTLLAQFSKLDFLLPAALSGNLVLLSAVFKTMLIMIFFALALSWVKEEKKKQFVALKETQFQINASDKSVHIILPDGSSRKVSLNQSRFDLLQKFAKARVNGNSWLRIKPKDARSNVEYDISDHNQIRRLNESLLDGLYGAHMWKINEEGEAFRKDFYLKETGKLKWSITPEQIEILDA